MAVTVANGRIGAAIVEIDSTDMGGTLGAIEFTATVEEAELFFDQLGTGPVDINRTGLRAQLVVPWAEEDIDKLASYLPGLSVEVDSVDSTKKKIEVTTGVGQQTLRDSLDVKVVLKPLVNPSTVADANEWLTFPTAHIQANLSQSYVVNGQRVRNITFIALPDAAALLYILGDETASA